MLQEVKPCLRNHIHTPKLGDAHLGGRKFFLRSHLAIAKVRLMAPFWFPLNNPHRSNWRPNFSAPQATSGVFAFFSRWCPFQPARSSTPNHPRPKPSSKRIQAEGSLDFPATRWSRLSAKSTAPAFGVRNPNTSHGRRFLSGGFEGIESLSKRKDG